MFKTSIEKAGQFTRPIHSIIRTYGGGPIIPGASTLFFVNEDGYAVTCKHVLNGILASESITHNYLNFKSERDKLPKDENYDAQLKRLEQKYQLKPETEIQAKNNFMDCVDGMSGFTAHSHPTMDLAIIKFNDFTTRSYEGYAVFKKDASQIQPGEFLCRLGFPFPEFTNYQYNTSTDDIEWTNTGVRASPRFPIEGMVTRFLAENNQLYGIEMSTPGLRGQSGGPLFDKDGLVCGMQFSTKHLHLGFDQIDKEILINTQTKTISDYSFLHLGQCIHVDIIKNFLREKKIKFYEG